MRATGILIGFTKPNSHENCRVREPYGVATDPTDGTLSGSALMWTDSLEGQFERSNQVYVRPGATLAA